MSSPEVFRRLADGMDLGIVLTNAGQAVEYANSYAERLFGVPLAGRPASFLRPLIASASAQSLEMLRGEVLVLNEPMGRQARCFLNVAPLSRDPDETGLVWTFFEMTDELANTQALIDFSAELTEANRDLKKMNEAVLVLTRTDALTGLASRRAVLDVLHKALEFASLRGQDVSVALLSVDNLAAVNRTDGFDAGDRALKEAADLAAQALGSDGTLGRYSSHGFLAVLPGTDLAQARALAEVLRKAVAKAGVPLVLRVAAASHRRGATLDELLRAVETNISSVQ